MSRQIDRVAARLEPPFPPEVAELIECLDKIASDDEREADPDYEPSLGSGVGSLGEVDLELDNSDWELSLGWTLDGEMGSSGWLEVTFESCGRLYRRAVEFDEREIDADAEPWLSTGADRWSCQRDDGEDGRTVPFEWDQSRELLAGP